MSMIVNMVDKGYQTQSHRVYPENWGGAEWLPVPPELENKVRGSYPNYELVIQDGVLLDVTPIVQPADLDTLRAAKQEQNKKALADWLAAHPLTWTDGKVYGVTEQDQTEMAINLAQYQLAAAAGQPAVLEWHTQKKSCHTFTLEEYTALSLAIAAYVYPYRRYLEAVKETIYEAQSKEELDVIEIDYGSVGAAA